MVENEHQSFRGPNSRCVTLLVIIHAKYIGHYITVIFIIAGPWESVDVVRWRHTSKECLHHCIPFVKPDSTPLPAFLCHPPCPQCGRDTMPDSNSHCESTHTELSLTVSYRVCSGRIPPPFPHACWLGFNALWNTGRGGDT